MSYQFGTNWSNFSDKAGPILGPLMAYEVLSASFLEAGFLGVMLFGMPEMTAEETRYAVEIPKLGGLILTHSLDGQVPGLKNWEPHERPNAAIVFWSFRLMVGMGLIMVPIGAVSLFLRWRGRLFETAWFRKWVLAMGPSGFVAVIAGWITTEVGRQPYTIYGRLRTAESVPAIEVQAVVRENRIWLSYGSG